MSSCLRIVVCRRSDGASVAAWLASGDVEAQAALTRETGYGVYGPDDVAVTVERLTEPPRDALVGLLDPRCSYCGLDEYACGCADARDDERDAMEREDAADADRELLLMDLDARRADRDDDACRWQHDPSIDDDEDLPFATDTEAP